MQKKTKIGLIGTGWIASYHVTGYQALGNKVEIYAIADLNKKRAEELSKETNAKHVFADYQELLNLDEIDAVDIALPTYLHAEVAIRACQKGKHVLCEKPFASTVEECEKMIAVARKAGVLLMPVHNCIFSSILLEAYKVLKEKKIGKPIIYKGNHICGYPGGSLSFLYRNWRGNKGTSGGGAIIEGGTHSIYIAEKFMGRISRVSAKLTHFPSGGFNIENGGLITLEFKSGAVGILTIYWGVGFADDGVEIIGTKGAITVSGVEWETLRQPILGIYSDPQGRGQEPGRNQSWEFPRVVFDWSQSFGNIIAHFIACIRDGKRPMVTAEDGKSAIKVVQAIYQSAKQGKWITV